MLRLKEDSQPLGWRLGLAVLLPFVLETIYLFFSRWPVPRFTPSTDFASLALSTLAGSALILTLPPTFSRRALSFFAYIPIIGVALILYGLMFLAVAFGDGL